MSRNPYFTLALLFVGSSLQLASCTSKYRSDGKTDETTTGGAGGTTSTTAPSTGGTSPSGGGGDGGSDPGGSSGGSNGGSGNGGNGGSEVSVGGTASSTSNGGSDPGGSGGSDVGGDAGAPGETTTDTTDTTGMGGSMGGGSGAGGTGTGGDGGAGGGTGGGGTGGGGTGGTGGGGGTSNVDMHCEPDAPDCACDDTGCFLILGASCTQATDCKTQICGVTQAATNVCCADSCGNNQVCSDDGTQCEAADVCEDDVERCNASGNHQVCTDGQWDSVENCEGRGCSLDLTEGCLGELGDNCAENEECGLGTCQETDDGSEACCDASCGDCLVCNQAGDGCVDPPTPKAGCECTQADASNCNDDLSCTDDSCVDGRCVNDLENGFCLIDGECLDHNQQELGNPCRYCDSLLRDRAWTNSSNSVSCDDNLWCTGTDTCNGSGQCQHQFPTSDRCTESGLCALAECDEDRDSCYEPSSTVCDTQVEQRCDPNDACGADVQSKTTTTKCSGSSAACNGNESSTTWTTSTACGSTKKCDDDSLTCKGALNCGDSWCDPAVGGLCWTTFEDEPEPMDKAAAIAYCNSLDRAGRGPGSWRVPEINEWLKLAKGCDNELGQWHTEEFQSTCLWDGTETVTPCAGSCPEGYGPGNGCYWPSAMGQCDPVGYWSASEGAGTYYFYATSNWAVSLSDFSAQAVRCVTSK